MTVTFCSVAAPSDLAAARVLASALRKQHPDARVVVLRLDETSSATNREPFETLAPAAFAEPSDGVTDKLWYAARLLQRELADAELVIYLDPAIWPYGSFEPALALGREHGIVLTPRAGALPEDGKRPSASDLLAAGRISDNFIAVGQAPDGQRFLEWWSQSQPRDGSAGSPMLNDVVELFPGAALLEDPGFNVSFWNLHERRLERRGEQLLAAGRPLRFVHFAGFRPDHPYWLSEHSTRVRVVDDPILADLCIEYAQRLSDAGWEPPANLEGVDRLGNGQRLDHLARTLWREAIETGPRFGDPMSRTGADAFVAWMLGPAPRGADAGVNRYLLAAYLTRPDLQRAFPELDEQGGHDLVAWARQQAGNELLAELIPGASGRSSPYEPPPPAVQVIGYLEDTLGVAEGARLYVETLKAAGLPVSTTAVPPDMGEGRQRATTRHGHRPYQELRASRAPLFNVICLNGEQLETFMRVGGGEVLGGRPTIATWSWETDVLPASWLGGFRHLDEIWVNSTFVAEKLGRLSPLPVVVVPHCLVVPDPAGVELELIRDERFTFLFMMDFFSTLRRKNALGLIDAFMRAFAPDEGPRLLLKTINAPFREKAFDELRFKIDGRPDIELVDGYMEALQKTALLARADCYVSLHRSEGFGLTLTESMALGTPVIATGYSGNTDFMTPHNSYLVDWTPTPVGPECEIYPAHGTWAEPDLEHAAELMRRVWMRPQEAASKAQRAQSDIDRLYSPEATGRVARARLERLLDTRAGEGVRRGAPENRFEQIEHELATDLRQGAPPVPRGVAGLLRRVVLRLMFPFTFHQRKLDQAMFQELRELRADLDRERDLRVASESAKRVDDPVDGHGDVNDRMW